MPLSGDLLTTLYDTISVESNYASNVNDRLCAAIVRSVKSQNVGSYLDYKFDIGGFNVTQALSTLVPVVMPAIVAQEMGKCRFPSSKVGSPQTILVTVQTTWATHRVVGVEYPQ